MARVRAHLTLNHPVINDIGMKEARRKVADMTRATLNRATVLTPVDTGNLRSGNNSRLFERGLRVFGEVFNQTEYAAAVHNGSRAYTVRPKTLPRRVGINSAGLPIFQGGVLRFEIGGKIVYARSAEIPARKGRPWLEQAMIQTAPRYGFVIENL